MAADIVQLEGLSGHADKNGLLKWVNSFEKKPEEVFVVHGEDAVCEAFTSCLNSKPEHHTSEMCLTLLQANGLNGDQENASRRNQNRAVLISDCLQPASV